MHFYSQLITMMFPFVIISQDNHNHLVEYYVVDYLDNQVVTYTGDIVVAYQRNIFDYVIDHLGNQVINYMGGILIANEV